MSLEPESRETKPPAIPRHPILAHLTLGTFAAAGLFDVLSALPHAALPSRELYRAAAFLLILGAVAVVSALGSGFANELGTPREAPQPDASQTPTPPA
jgi:uncharacterized membrane protein